MTAKTTTNIVMVAGEVYQRFKYPASETQVRLTEAGIKLLTGSDEVRVIARIRSSDDLIELVQLLSAIESVAEFAAVEVVLPYLPYGRADRRFVPGDCFGVEAFGNILAATGISNVRTLDVHSRVSRIKVPNLVNVRPDPLIRKAIEQFATTCNVTELNVLFPDEGARARYSDLVHAAPFGNNLQAITCNFEHATKRRDPATGALSGFRVPKLKGGIPTIIIDDLCDGGGTFVGLADEMPCKHYRGLYVTHGIFSKGTNVLTQKFYRVYTTNSFRDYKDDLDLNPYVMVFDAMPLLLGGPEDIQ